MEVKLKNVRLSFPNLWHAKEFKTGDGKLRFDASFLCEPGSENDKAIRAAIAAEAKEAYGAKWESILRGMQGNANRYVYQDGDTKPYAGYEGMWVLACHSKARPLIINRDKSPLSEEDGRPYAGCYVNAKVDIYAQKGENQGIRASFSGIQFVSEGEAFTGGKPASTDDFDDLGEGSDVDDLI